MVIGVREIKSKEPVIRFFSSRQSLDVEGSRLSLAVGVHNDVELLVLVVELEGAEVVAGIKLRGEAALHVPACIVKERPELFILPGQHPTQEVHIMCHAFNLDDRTIKMSLTCV